MTVHRYAVIDADGFKINTILVDDDTVDGYYPGYGAFLIDEGEEPEELKEPPPPPKPADFGVLKVALYQPMLVGDRIDIKSGAVTSRDALAEVSVDPEPAIKPPTR